jgi:hypothetical protein
MKKIGRKGQVLSFDLIIAGIIFLLLLSTAFYIYNGQKYALQEQNTLQKMHLSAVNSLNSILSDQNCYKGGIINQKGVLSSQKIACFDSLDYNYLKEILSLEEYEFTISITDGNASSLQKGNTTTKRAIAVQRIAVLENRAKKINFVLFEK